MEVVHTRCAGIDISKRDAKVCVRVQEPTRARSSSTVTTWGSVTSQILALRDDLIAQKVTLVVMEATSDYWKPFYYLLDDGPFEMMLVNARHVKNLPGRKTDVSDAAWLAQLGHGLVRGSFVPRAHSSTARPHAHANCGGARTHSRVPASGENARRLRHQALLGGEHTYRCFGTIHARRTRCGRTRPRGVGGHGPASATRQDPRTNRGVIGTLQRPPRLLGEAPPRTDRRAHPSH